VHKNDEDADENEQEKARLVAAAAGRAAVAAQLLLGILHIFDTLVARHRSFNCSAN